MKRYLIVAGVDYEFKGVDFRSLADNRRRRITRDNSAKQDLQFIVIDFRAGEVAVTDVTYPGGKKSETTSSTKPFAPVGQTNYQNVTYPDGSTHTRFKPGQTTVGSITDVYKKVRDIGSSDPGSLAELSFFSHGWMGGPILVDSDDDRTAVVTTTAGGVSTTRTLTITGTARDPDDKDPRPQYDFVAPTMDATALGLFQKAFASDGIIWLWGCSFPQVVHHTLWAMENNGAYKSTGVGDNEVFVMNNVTKDDIEYMEFFLKPFLGTFPSRSSVTLKFKYLKYFVCAANQSAFASQIATAAKANCHAAPLGTYADYDTNVQLPLMSVYSGFTAHFNFYKNYLGMTFDPEGRHYGVYKPGMTCATP